MFTIVCQDERSPEQIAFEDSHTSILDMPERSNIILPSDFDSVQTTKLYKILGKNDPDAPTDQHLGRKRARVY